MASVGGTQRSNKRSRLRRSCTECRRRKQACDGRVPNCKSCQSRKVTHLCRWGDERDSFVAASPTAALYPSSSSSSPAQLNTNASSYGGPTPLSSASTTNSTNMPRSPNSSQQISTSSSTRGAQLVKTLAQGDLGLGGNSSTAYLNVDNPEETDTYSSEERPCASAAKELLQIYRQHLAWCGAQIFDWDVLLKCSEKGNSDDVESLVLLLCSAALESLPPSMSLSLSYAGSFEEIDVMITSWTLKAINLLLGLDFYFEPTLFMVQAVNVYQLYLVHRVDKIFMIRTMDLAIRAARRLGIDRLGSDQDDERAWRIAEETRTEFNDGKEALPHHSFGDWAVETFAKRDRIAREIARSHWWILVSRDWGATRQMGSYLIHQSSFTTKAPKVYVFQDADPQDQRDLWFYFVRCSEISMNFNDLCINAATLRSSADSLYGQILELDRRLNELLDSRPTWLRPENFPLHLPRATVVVEVQGHTTRNTSAAVFLSSLIWHRLFLIHRPFLALGRCGKEKYRLSANRPLNNAMLFLHTESQAARDGILIMNRSVHLLRLLQAALVIISDCLLRNDDTNEDDEGLLYKDPFIIQGTLSEAIMTFAKLSSVKQVKTKGVYDGVYTNLQALLRACAQITQSSRFGTASKSSSNYLRSIVSPRTWHIDDHISSFIQQEHFTNMNMEAPAQAAQDLTQLWQDLLPFFSV